MAIFDDGTTLEFDTKEEAVDFIPDIMVVLDKLPEIKKLQEEIRQMKVGDEINKSYSFDSNIGMRKIALQIILYNDQLSIYVKSDNKIVDALDDKWWDKYPDE